MNPIVDVKLVRGPDRPPAPDKGFYVRLDYMYGDADGSNSVIAGPFPEDKKHLYLEFLNLLDTMKSWYPHGKGGYDGYEDVPGYAEWFGDDDFDPEDDGAMPADLEFIRSLGLEVEYWHDGLVASFQGYECYWHDGATPDKYPVEPVRQGD